MKKAFVCLMLSVNLYCIAQTTQHTVLLDENQLTYNALGTALTSDPSAHDVKCMFRSGQTGGGTIWYGPYMSLKPGNYTVQFRIKLGSTANSGYLFQVDASSPSAGILASTGIRSGMFRAANEWQLISIPLNVQGNVSDMEFRGIDFQGGTDVYFDYVQIVPSQLNGLVSENFTSLGNGNIGIGTANPAEKLSVNGNIRAKEVKVEVSNWPDYVFKDNYKLDSLTSVERFIKANGHLPEMPNAKSVEKEGLTLGLLLRLQQKKIEELTLYLIEKDKQLSEQAKINKWYEERLLKLEEEKKR